MSDLAVRMFSLRILSVETAERKRMQMLARIIGGVPDTHIIPLSGNTIGKVEIIGLCWSRYSFIPWTADGYVARIASPGIGRARARGVSKFREYRPFITANFARNSSLSRETVWDILFSCAFIAAAWIARDQCLFPSFPLPLSLCLSLFCPPLFPTRFLVRYNSWQSGLVLAGILAIQSSRGPRENNWFDSGGDGMKRTFSLEEIEALVSIARRGYQLGAGSMSRCTWTYQSQVRYPSFVSLVSNSARS